VVEATLRFTADPGLPVAADRLIVVCASAHAHTNPMYKDTTIPQDRIEFNFDALIALPQTSWVPKAARARHPFAD
jgi:hypothetical protein